MDSYFEITLTKMGKSVVSGEDVPLVVSFGTLRADTRHLC